MLGITREGKRFLLAVLIIGFAALNTGNNLMYLIFSMMLSTLILSLIIPYLNLKKLNVKFELEEPVFAGTPTSMKLNVTNNKTLLPSFSFRFSISMPESDELYIESIKPTKSETKSQRIVFNHRGLYTIRDTILYTEFPFIFFSFKKRPEGEAKVLVYPLIYDLSNEMTVLTTNTDTGNKPKIGLGEDFFMVRRFRFGDETRSIHWKATARTGKIMVKEFHMNEPEKVTILLDNLYYNKEEQFEKAISFTASFISELINSFYTVRLITCHKVIPFGSGNEHLYKILDLLSVIKQRNEFNCSLDEQEDIDILILSSEISSLMRFSSIAAKVYYANTL